MQNWWRWDTRLPLVIFSSRRRHTRLQGDWSSDVCSSDSLNGVRAETPKHQFAVAVDPYLKAGAPGSGLLPFVQSVEAGEEGRLGEGVVWVEGEIGGGGGSLKKKKVVSLSLVYAYEGRMYM